MKQSKFSDVLITGIKGYIAELWNAWKMHRDMCSVGEEIEVIERDIDLEEFRNSAEIPGVTEDIEVTEPLVKRR